MSPPVPENLSSLRGWLQRPEYGNNFLVGRVEGVWDIEKCNTDFVAVGSKTGENDLLIRLIGRILPHVQRRWYGNTQREKIYSLGDSSLRRISNALSTVLACILPTLAILVLYSVRPMKIRLGLILVFTALVATVLVLGTRARRVEIFAATTA